MPRRSGARPQSNRKSLRLFHPALRDRGTRSWSKTDSGDGATTYFPGAGPGLLKSPFRPRRGGEAPASNGERRRGFETRAEEAISSCRGGGGAATPSKTSRPAPSVTPGPMLSVTPLRPALPTEIGASRPDHVERANRRFDLTMGGLQAFDHVSPGCTVGNVNELRPSGLAVTAVSCVLSSALVRRIGGSRWTRHEVRVRCIPSRIP